MRSIANTAVAAKPWPRQRIGLARPLVLLVVAIVAIGGYFAYDRFLKPQPVATVATQKVAVTRGTIATTVSGTGSVVPAQTTDLAFNTSGTLVALNATLGQSVKKGDVLARLETTDLNLALLTAQSTLATAQSNLATLEAGSTAGEIAQARASLKSTQATLNKVRAGATATDLQSAEASVASARSSLQKAETDLADLKSGLTQDEIITAQVNIEKSKIAVHNAQVAYDKIAWRADAGATTEAMNLWQATTDLQAAQVAYNTAMAGPTKSELTVAEQNVVSAKAQLASAEAKLVTLQQGATEDELASAEAALIQAQTQLEQKLNPSTAAQKLAALAAVEQAKVGVQSAQNNLDKAAMVAPFDGIVSTVTGSVGQKVSSTVVTLLDMSAPQLQFTLTESDVAKVAVGQQAVLTFDALGSSQQIAGKVLTISPKATVSSGVATYTATVSIEKSTQGSLGAAGATAGQSGQATATGSSQQAQGATGAANPPSGQKTLASTTADLSKIKAGMTGSVTITYLRKDNVLVVPNKAIKTQGQNRLVEVLVDGKTETRTVTVGIADSQNTEIVSGLQEGDTVVTSGTTSTTTTSTSSTNRNQQGGAPVGIPGLGPGGPGY